MASTPFLYFVLRGMRILADWFTSCIGIIYLPHKSFLPPIANRLLLESATSLSAKISSGQVKCEQVMKIYIDRIKAVNPFINALIQDRFELALNEAREIDRRVQHELKGNEPIDGESVLGLPLLGVPLSVKDCIAVKDMDFSAGLYSRKGVIAEEDSEIVTNLRKAGAIPIGLTNVPEFLLWWDCYNKIYGQTNNPYDKSRVSGGSSGGEAALISAAGSVVGVGTDIGGSLRIPTFFCGVYGHKPTHDVVSIDGLFPTSGHPERDKYMAFGPVCRYAADLKPMLTAMAGKNSCQFKFDKEIDFSKLKIYYMESDGDPFKTNVSQEIIETMHKVIEYLKKETNASSEKLDLNLIKDSFYIWLCSLANFDAPPFASEITLRQEKLNGWKELSKWCIGRSNFRFTTTFNVILESLFLPEGTREKDGFKKIVSAGDKIREEFNKILDEDTILLFPCLPETAPKHNGTLLKVNNLGYVMIFNILQVPVTQVPLGMSKSGLPIGLQIVAGQYNDHLTIAIAELLEKGFGGWVPPCRISLPD